MSHLLAGVFVVIATIQVASHVRSLPDNDDDDIRRQPERVPRSAISIIVADLRRRRFIAGDRAGRLPHRSMEFASA